MKLSTTLKNIITQAYDKKIINAVSEIQEKAREQVKVLQQQLQETPEAIAAFNAQLVLYDKYTNIIKDDKVAPTSKNSLYINSLENFLHSFSCSINTRALTDAATKQLEHERDMILIKLEYDRDINDITTFLATYGITL